MKKPAPLVPKDVDLRSLEYMPLYLTTLTKSKTWLLTKRKPMLMRPLLALWITAWQSVPAGSLEADDDVLAHAAELTFSDWIDYKTDLIRGWKLCRDGRYHIPSMTGMVLRAFALVANKRTAGKLGAAARWGEKKMAPAMAPAMPRRNSREGGSKEKKGAHGAANGKTHPREAYLKLDADTRAGRTPTDPTTLQVLEQLGGLDAWKAKTDRARADLLADFEKRYAAAQH